MTVLTSGGAGGKTVQLVSSTMMAAASAPGGHHQQQQMVLLQQPTAGLAHSDGPVTSDAALAQLAAEAGLLEEGGQAADHHQLSEVWGSRINLFMFRKIQNVFNPRSILV